MGIVGRQAVEYLVGGRLYLSNDSQVQKTILNPNLMSVDYRNCSKSAEALTLRHDVTEWSRSKEEGR